MMLVTNTFTFCLLPVGKGGPGTPHPLHCHGIGDRTHQYVSLGSHEHSVQTQYVYASSKAFGVSYGI